MAQKKDFNLEKHSLKLRHAFFKLIFEQSIDIIILNLLEEVCSTLELDRGIYVRWDSKQGWIMAVDKPGHGVSIAPGAGYNIGDLFKPDLQSLNKWTCCPQTAIGVDVVYMFEVNVRKESTPYIAAIGLDKTDQKREFTNDEIGYLYTFAETFVDVLQTKLNFDILYVDAKRQMIDNLTGLPNRRSYEQLLGAEHYYSASQKCLIMIDLDNFKAVNEYNNYQTGNIILKTFANLLRKFPNSNVFRIGGQEFAVVYYGDSNSAVKCLYKLLEKWRHLVMAGIKTWNSNWKKSFSAGICAIYGTLTNDEAWQWADRALYKAKREKGIICLADPFKTDKIEQIVGMELTELVGQAVVSIDSSTVNNNKTPEFDISMIFDRVYGSKEDGSLVWR